MNAWINLLVSSVLAGVAGALVAVQGGSNGKGVAASGLTALLTALGQHLRQPPDVKL